jgi:hypothetical protein
MGMPAERRTAFLQSFSRLFTPQPTHCPSEQTVRFLFFSSPRSNLCMLLHELIPNPSDSVSDDRERWNPANEFPPLSAHTQKNNKSDSYFLLLFSPAF